MKLYYATDPDAGARHFIYHAVLNRDAITFTHSTNVPLSEMTVDEIDDNKDLINDLARTLGKTDADDDCKYYIDATGDIVEKENWEAWVNIPNGTEPPVLDKAVYLKVSVTVDAVKARLGELSEKLETGPLSTAEKDEAFGLILEKQATTTANIS